MSSSGLAQRDQMTTYWNAGKHHTADSKQRLITERLHSQSLRCVAKLEVSDCKVLRLITDYAPSPVLQKLHNTPPPQLPLPLFMVLLDGVFSFSGVDECYPYLYLWACRGGYLGQQHLHEDLHMLEDIIRTHILVALNTWSKRAGPTCRMPLDDHASSIDFLLTCQETADTKTRLCKTLWQHPLRPPDQTHGHPVLECSIPMQHKQAPPSKVFLPTLDRERYIHAAMAEPIRWARYLEAVQAQIAIIWQQRRLSPSPRIWNC